MKYCEEFAALLDPYVDGELPLEEAARVRAHLAVCGGCRAYVQAALAIRDAFPDAEETEVPEGFAEGVMAAVRANAAPRRRSRPRWQRTLLPLAACFAVAVLAISGLPRLQDNTAESIRAEDAAVTAAGETAPEKDLQAFSADSGEDIAPAEAEASAGQEIAGTEGSAPTAPKNGVSAAEAGTDAGGETRTVPQTQAEAAPAVLDEDAGPSCFATLTLTWEQAGTALGDLPPDTPVSSDPATGGTVYYLTAEQFEDLLDELGDPPYTAEGDGGLARVILLPEGADGEAAEPRG